MPTKNILIKGKVQGVFYRVTAKEIARKIGLKGWIKNLSDGSVECTATGTEDQLNDFIGWCGTGPEDAEVDDVIVKNLPETVFDDFVVLRHQS